jgi:membrane associated rhomboid family serine protease
MSEGSRVCPGCGALNGIREPQCHRCGRPLASARGAAAGFFDTPFLATRILLGICLVNFALMVLDHGGLPMVMFGKVGRPPSDSELLRWGGLLGGVAENEPWRYLSAVFVHLDPLHLLFHGMAVLALGRRTEQRVGGPRMVVAFTITGIVGFLASALWYGSSPYGTAGASGALFGLMGHEIGQMHARRDPRLKDVLFQFGAYTLAFALMFNVNSAAHLGGFIAGYPLGRLFASERRPWRLDRLFQVLAGLCIVASVASIVLSATSPAWERARADEVLHGER